MFSARFGHFWSGKYTLHIFRSKNKKKKKKIREHEKRMPDYLVK